MVEIKWPPLYKVESEKFTLSPKLFASWLQFLLFSRDTTDVPQFDLESEELNEISKEMQEQIKKGGKSK